MRLPENVGSLSDEQLATAYASAEWLIQDFNDRITNSKGPKADRVKKLNPQPSINPQYIEIRNVLKAEIDKRKSENGNSV